MDTNAWPERTGFDTVPDTFLPRLQQEHADNDHRHDDHENGDP
jgi:hypothetical protein